MKLGFTNRQPDIGGEVNNGVPVYSPHTKNANRFVNLVKIVGGILTILVILGGLVWSSAWLFASKASTEELGDVEDRIEMVEKNDIRQTTILEQIQVTVKKIDEKLDSALQK